MAKLPDLNALGARPSLQTSGPVRIPAATGPGQAMAQMGGSLSAIGEMLEKEQAYQDKLGAEDAFNRLRSRQLDLTLGESGFAQKKGKDAGGNLIGDYTNQFESVVREIGDELDNDQQRELFRQRADVSALQFKQDLLNHVTTQREAYAEQVFKGGLEIETSNAGARWRDPNGVKLSLERVNGLIREEADRNGWAPEVVQAEQLRQSTAVHASVISNAIEAGNSDYAKRWYQDHKDAIDSEKHPAIEKALKTAGLKELGQVAVDDIMLRHDNETEALAEARKKFKGEEEDAVVERIKHRFAELRQADTERRKGLTRDAWNVIKNGGIPDDLSADQLDALEGSTIASMWSFTRTKDKRVTDLDKWDEFERALAAGDITERDQVRDYEQFFSPQDARTAMKAFEKRGEVSVTDLKRAFVDRVGKTQAKWGGGDTESWIAFQSYMLDKVKETRRPEDIEVWADRWFMSGETLQDRWGFDPDTFGEAVVEGRGDEFMFDVPDEIDTDVRAAMQAAGAPEGTSKAFYTHHYLPATDYLRAHEIPINPRTIGAVAILRANNKPVTPANVDYVAGQM